MTDTEFQAKLNDLMMEYIGNPATYERTYVTATSLLGATLWSLNSVDIMLGAGAPNDDTTEAGKVILRGLTQLLVTECPVSDGEILCEMYDGLSYIYCLKYLKEKISGEVALASATAGLATVAARLIALAFDFENDEARVEHLGVRMGENLSKIVMAHYEEENPETGMRN